MKDLKSVLNAYGRTERLGIYRGDSFQLVVDPADALVIVLLLKATIKQQSIRCSYGNRNGTIDYTSNKVTESNGSAFINSGECFEGLKNKLWEYKRLGLDLTRLLQLFYN
jgi:hypothetical protein